MMFMAPTFDVIDAIVPKDTEITARGHLSALWRETALASAQVALRIVLLAHSAWLMGDAIVRTLYRLNLSNRDLLEWRTALQAHKSGDNTIVGYYRTMYGAVVIGLVGLAIPLAAGSSGAGVALIFALFWTGSPAFAWLISRSAETEDRLIVAEADKATLRAYGRRTWLYFETFVTSEHNMLPPDNFQETPAPVVASRTSPTNIGVYLLSVISARDFGWISLVEATDRLAATLATIEKLPAYRGHLYNWYETRTLAPLSPRYVSSVDSGNLAGHLIAVAAACNEWAMAPAAFLEGDFHGTARCRDDPRGKPDGRARRSTPAAGRCASACASACRASGAPSISCAANRRRRRYARSTWSCSPARSASSPRRSTRKRKATTAATWRAGRSSSKRPPKPM